MIDDSHLKSINDSTVHKSMTISHFYNGQDSNLALASQISTTLRQKMNQELVNAWEVADILTAMDDVMEKRFDWVSDFLEIGNAFVSSISKEKSGQDSLDFFKITSSISDQPETARKFINLLKGGWWPSDLQKLLEKAKSSTSWFRIVPVWRRFS